MHRLYLLHNPEINTYGTMAYLIRFCDHQKEQAEQCAVIAENVGRCAIKTGSITEILEVYNILKGLGLLLEIKEIKKLT